VQIDVYGERVPAAASRTRGRTPAGGPWRDHRLDQVAAPIVKERHRGAEQFVRRIDTLTHVVPRLGI
jgi:hypothetical protein